MDVAKGSAILGVILVHALIVGVWFVPGNALSVLPLWVLAFLSPLVIISTWAGFFELMSGLANAFQLYDRVVVREMEFKKAATGPLVNSTGLLLVHFLFIFFFSHRRNPPYPDVGTGEIHTVITGSLELGAFTPTSYQYFFFASVLGSIAVAGYFAVLVIWVVYKINQLRRINQTAILFTIFAILFFTVSYPIWDLGYGFIIRALVEGSPGMLALAFPLALFTGAFQPFFPIGGFALLGSIIGILLAAEQLKKTDPLRLESTEFIGARTYMKWVSLLSFLAFVGLLLHYLFILHGNPLDILSFYRLPPIMLALNVSLMLLTFNLAIRLFEDQPEKVRKRRAERTLWVRRFGMVTLTVYVLESVVTGFFSYIYHSLVDDPNTEVMESWISPIPIILFTTFLVAFWFGVVILWERYSFKYSIEWWIVKIGGKFRSSKSRKLDLTANLHHPLGRPQITETAD